MKASAELIFLGVDETRIVVLPGGFELRAFDADERGDFAGCVVRCHADLPL